MNFLRLRRTPKLAVPKHETDTFFVDADGVFKKMAPDGTVSEVGGGGGGGSTTMHGLMANVVGSFDGVNFNWPVTNEIDLAVIYDTDGYVVDGGSGGNDFVDIQIPTGLGGVYIVEAVLYVRDQSDGLTSVRFLLNDPSDNCDFMLFNDAGAGSFGVGPVASASFTRVILDGEQVHLDLLDINGGPTHIQIVGADVVDGGSSPSTLDVTQSTVSLTRLCDAPTSRGY